MISYLIILANILTLPYINIYIIVIMIMAIIIIIIRFKMFINSYYIKYQDVKCSLRNLGDAIT